MTLYQWPDQAAFGRIVPKHKIYENATVSTALKDRFVAEVAQIRWAYKLSPDTTRLPATENVSEIQVFRIQQRVPALNHDILHAIDRAIPSPIFFELIFEDREKYAAAHKRPHAQGGERWVISDYFEGEWQPADAARTTLPHALDLEKLYAQILGELIDRMMINLIGEAIGRSYLPDYNLSMADLIAIDAQIVGLEAIKKQVREIEKLEKRVQREKQFNKRVELNSRLKKVRKNLIQATSRHFNSR